MSVAFSVGSDADTTNSWSVLPFPTINVSSFCVGLCAVHWTLLTVVRHEYGFDNELYPSNDVI